MGRNPKENFRLLFKVILPVSIGTETTATYSWNWSYIFLEHKPESKRPGNKHAAQEIRRPGFFSSGSTTF